jgi:hypothetical protein
VEEGNIVRDSAVTYITLVWRDTETREPLSMGVCIAAQANRDGHEVLQPWQMHPSDAPVEYRRSAKPSTISRMQYFARRAGWDECADAIGAAGFTVEQEALEHSA